jgi:hypothetical protein
LRERERSQTLLMEEYKEIHHEEEEEEVEKENSQPLIY